jgi:hypothetical protein
MKSMTRYLEGKRNKKVIQMIRKINKSDLPQNALVNVRPIINSHKTVFQLARSSVNNSNVIKGLAIPEEYIRTIFE